MGIVLLLMAVGVSWMVLAMSVGASKCIDAEREVLLQFKRNIVDEQDRLHSWGNHNEDCCRGWTGVGCDNLTGHVIKIDLYPVYLPTAKVRYTSIPFIDELRYLKYLDLGLISNLLANQSISTLIGSNDNNNGSMVSLQHLGLRDTGIVGTIPDNFGSSMPALTHLDLSVNGLQGPIPENFGNCMPALTHLDLSVNGLQGPIPENFGNCMPALTHLDLSANGLQGPIPENFGNCMSALTHLDLSVNGLQGPIPENFGNCMSALTHLDLSANGLQGPILENGFGHMWSLAYLDISGNFLGGQIPTSFGENMTSLTYLGLSYTSLEGSIPESFGKLVKLTHLHLSYNRFEGEIPKSIWNICTLKNLDLEFNHLNGSLIMSTLCPNHPLQLLYLTSNRLMGSFPELTMFPYLNELHLGNNLLHGVISEHHFVTLSHLYKLDLSSNNVTFNFTSTWLPPFQLQFIYLQSCNLGPEFPNWLRTQVNYIELDISNNAISDSIPSWFWNTTTEFLRINASHNAIKGRIVSSAQVSPGFRTAVLLDLSFNELEGSIPQSFFNVSAMYLSHNNITEINSLCDIKGPKAAIALRLLDISFNQLSGTLPDCWSSLSSLVVLNLANNHNLSGSLPTSIGSLASLWALHLDHNSFTGVLPSSIKNCSKLVSLQLGHNNLSGPIPDWVGESLPQLAVLVLGSNHFSASVPTSLCHLQSLQLLDLSMNHLSGSLPNCLLNLTQMNVIKGGSPRISLEISVSLEASTFSGDMPINEDDKTDTVWKGKVSEFDSILGLLKSIDLSSNVLTGEIPSEITSLVGLRSLNLSQNNLSGQIPLRIGNLANLEALDLSNNHLSGSIPQSLALIDRISALNVSNNNLSGKIPKSTQLQSFDASAYMGNLGLCGDPLLNSCPGEELTYPSPPGLSEEEKGEDVDKIFGGDFYASMGVGYAFGFLTILGTVLFNRSFRFFFFKVLDNFANWAYVVAAIYKAKLLRILGS
ncbi:unnamed protein product [Cuscuta epithymum]|uniref:Leucine-rich repeat-containing N-terminal plant-type domain-containing protein n=1 Tax=Cuscuta epithymum TaxID=186058 RepID=A0AAV0FBU1_9ASTE|nr:unnamed protein product [Cuscuta epithymum]